MPLSKIHNTLTSDHIILDGTDGTGANANSKVLLDASASNTDVGSIMSFESGAGDGSSVVATSDTLVEIGDTGTITAGMLNGGQTGSAPIFGARAWVNFNGSGTVSVTASGNVSSITDNGTGNYTVNFTTAMPDANYCAVASGDPVSSISRNILHGVSDLTTGSYRYEVETSDGDAIDQAVCLSLVIK